MFLAEPAVHLFKQIFRFGLRILFFIETLLFRQTRFEKTAAGILDFDRCHCPLLEVKYIIQACIVIRSIVHRQHTTDGSGIGDNRIVHKID